MTEPKPLSKWMSHSCREGNHSECDGTTIQDGKAATCNCPDCWCGDE